MITAVDTNILIDILEPDPVFGENSKEAMKRCLQEGSVIACEVVWAEVLTAYYEKLETAVGILKRIGIGYSSIDFDAAVEAAKCWTEYRNRNITRDRIVPDFLIGGHAIIHSDRLLTRDRGFFRDYFKPLKVEAPLQSSRI